MGNRRQPRTRVGLKVTVSGVDSDGNRFVQTAYARDLSCDGARLDGLALLKAPGQTLTVEHRGRSAEFLVVWVGEPGREEQGQVGIRSLGPGHNIWKVEMPRTGEDKYRGAASQPRPGATPAPAPPAPASATRQSKERRKRPRYRCSEISVEFCAPGSTVGMSGKLADIALTGCYIEVLVPCLQGTAVEVVLRHQAIVLRLPSRVVTAHPGMGMGLEFNGMGTKNSAALAALIEAVRIKQS